MDTESYSVIHGFCSGSVLDLPSAEKILERLGTMEHVKTVDYPGSAALFRPGSELRTRKSRANRANASFSVDD